MFKETPLGCRRKIKQKTPYYFMVMKDLLDLEKYQTEIRESKLRPKTEVVDYKKIFKEKN